MRGNDIRSGTETVGGARISLLRIDIRADINAPERYPPPWAVLGHRSRALISALISAR